MKVPTAPLNAVTGCVGSMICGRWVSTQVGWLYIHSPGSFATIHS